jgi:hypothetical protein
MATTAMANLATRLRCRDRFSILGLYRRGRRPDKLRRFEKRECIMTADAGDASTLEQRLRLIEDRLEIYNLIASHPPSADTGAGDYVASVWAEDGVFDRGAEFPRPTGRTAIAAGSSNPEHHRAIEEGIAHFAGLPYVRVSGDTAVAIAYLQILVPDRVGPTFDVPNHGASRGFHVHRVSANRWELVRTTEGWKIARRTLRPLDGSAPAREILRGALEP